MSNVDLSSASVLWQTLSKDVYTRGRDSTAAEVVREDLSVTEPLLQSTSKVTPCQKGGGAGWLMTSFLIVNTALGIGILNFPAAFDQAGGIFYATLIQGLMVTLMMSTMLILAYCSDVNGDRTYHDVLLSMCGRTGQQLAALSITITLYCVCVATLIIIGDQSDSLFYSMFGASMFCEKWYLHRTFTIPVVACLFILPACYCKSVDFLGYIGSIGIFAMLYPVFLTVYGYFKLTPNHAIIKTEPDDLSGMFAMFPVLGLGYQCQEVVVPVYSCMRDRNLWNFFKSSLLAMAFLFFVYSVTGCFGYLTFGSNVAHNVMKMYDPNDPFVVIGVGALAVKMIATYPILALCGRDAAAGLYAELRRLKPSEFVATEPARRYVFASIWFGSSLLLSVMTESIGPVIKYLGSVASANIFIYPGICLMQVVLKENPECSSPRSQFLVAYSILIAGVGAFCLGVVLFEAILDQSTETRINLCEQLTPINSTV